MTAVILVGGKALRLRPLTWRRPKAVVPILGQPLLATQLALLRSAGVTDIVLALASLPRRIHAVFGDGSAWGVSLRYSVEPEPMGTGGALGQLRGSLDSPFLCLNGDVLTDLDVEGLVASHRRAGAGITLSVAEVADASGFGAVEVRTAEAPESGHRVIGFEEKARSGPRWVSVGIYAMDPDVLDRIPSGRPVSLEHDVFPAAAASARGGRGVAAFAHRGYFRDVGVLERYQAAHRDALDGRIRIPGVGKANPGGAIVSENAVVHETAVVRGPTLIGDGAQVHAGAAIGPYAVLDRRVRVEAGARVEHSVLWPDTRIGEGAVVRRSVLGANGFVGQHARIAEAVLGDKSVVAAFSVVEGAG